MQTRVYRSRLKAYFGLFIKIIENPTERTTSSKVDLACKPNKPINVYRAERRKFNLRA